MSWIRLENVVKEGDVPPPFAGVGRGAFYRQNLYRGDMLWTDISTCYYNRWRHEAGLQVRDPANRTDAYDVEGTLMYLVNAGDSAEGAVWPVGYTRGPSSARPLWLGAQTQSTQWYTLHGVLALCLIHDVPWRRRTTST